MNSLIRTRRRYLPAPVSILPSNPKLYLTAVMALLLFSLPIYATSEAGAIPSRGMPPGEQPARNFWIFFDHKSFNLRPDATKTLSTVVETMNRLGTSSIILIAHTDTSEGNVEEAEGLSMQRAMRAKEYLVRRGVPPTNIKTIGRGKIDLRVPTWENIREPENRNVHIEIK